MATPKVIDIITANIWQKVATNVRNGFIRVVRPPGKTNVDAVYYHTHRHTGDAAPIDLDEGVPFDSRNIKIRSRIPIDIYVYVDIYGSGDTGKVRIDFSGGEVGNQDTFERVRVSEPQSLHDWKNIHSKGDEFWNEQIVGAGTIVHNPDKSHVELSVGTASGDKAVRQSTRYYPYFPGRSQLALLTGIAGEFKANVRKRTGLFDDLNGLFMEFNDFAVRLVRRSNTSGSVVDDAVEQADWNVDKMDGTGPSAIILNSTKSQIFVFDFQWLGVGIVRFGVSINGKTHYMHAINNANVRTEAYMATGSLPIRYEIENTGISASSSMIVEICSSIASEGGVQLFGFDGNKGNGITPVAVTIKRPIFAIRLTNTINGKPNRRTVVLNSFSGRAATNEVYLEIAHVKGHTGVTGAWTDYDTNNSGVQYSTDISAVAGGNQKFIDDLYIPAATGGRALAKSSTAGLVGRHHFLSQNIDSTDSELFVIFATSFTGTSNVSGSIKWIEME